jgi:uncharacterized membrane protein YphA (DoxX/SURF4 family)
MKNVSNKITTVARILVGLIFTVFGLNGFFHFLPEPTTMSAEAGALIGAFAATGYFFPVLKGTEVLAGLLLLGNRFVPLALTLLAPLIVQIVLFHVFLSPEDMAMTIFIVAAEIFLAWRYRDSFRGMLAATAQPVSSEPSRTGQSTAVAHA